MGGFGTWPYLFCRIQFNPQQCFDLLSWNLDSLTPQPPLPVAVSFGFSVFNTGELLPSEVNFLYFSGSRWGIFPIIRPNSTFLPSPSSYSQSEHGIISLSLWGRGGWAFRFWRWPSWPPGQLLSKSPQFLQLFIQGIVSLPSFLHNEGTSCLSLCWVKLNETLSGGLSTEQSRHICFQGIRFCSAASVTLSWPAHTLETFEFAFACMWCC